MCGQDKVIEQKAKKKGLKINQKNYNTECPFFNWDPPKSASQ